MWDYQNYMNINFKRGSNSHKGFFAKIKKKSMANEKFCQNQKFVRNIPVLDTRVLAFRVITGF